MRIVSNFKDYYDHLAYLGIDNKVVFERTTERLNVDNLKLERSTPYINNIRKSCTIDQVFIIVCNIAYTGWVYLNYGKQDEKQYIFNKEEAKKIYDFLAPERYINWKRVQMTQSVICEYPLVGIGVDYFPVKNPKLKDVNFHTVLSAEKVWQEICMFLSKEKVVKELELTESESLLRHGMDKKSFRK